MGGKDSGGGPSVGDLRSPLTIIFTIFAFSAIFVGSLVLVVVVFQEEETSNERDLDWWKRTIIYHVYIPSFYDSNDDGYGDINGVRDKLSYIQSLGVDCIWLSPFYKNFGSDLGNDVTDHTEVDPLFGTRKDLDELFDDIKKRGMYVILDLIPNHTSNDSIWFVGSENDRDGQYGNYYIWRDAQGFDVQGKPIPPNNWLAATGQSAWEWSDVREQFYFHNFLPEMPDLNLDEQAVRDEIKNIMNYWLTKEPVMGFHIGGINILFEDETRGTDLIQTNVNASIKFMDELHNFTQGLSDSDGLDRLFLLEIFDGQYVSASETYLQDFIRKHTKNAEVPFSFGDIPWRTTNSSFPGSSLEIMIRQFLEDGDESENNLAWPIWELNDHDAISSQGDSDHGRIPKSISDVILITSLMLPGTVIIYYGDEIGMASKTNITFEETVDPYARPPYANESDYKKKSRDPFRTPMQWSHEEHAGFTKCETGPWLPVAEDYNVVNVEDEKAKNESQLILFHKLASLRHHKALHSGKVYYPYHSEKVFSFMRKSSTDGTAFLVVIHLGQAGTNTETIDFTSILPMVSSKGNVILTSTLNKPSYLKLGPISMKNLTLYPQEGAVILLDYNQITSGVDGLFNSSKIFWLFAVASLFLVL